MIWAECSFGIAVIDRIVPHKPVQVDAPFVANRVTGHEPPGIGVVVAMPQKVSALEVVVVAVLTPEAHRVVGHRRTRRRTVGDELAIPPERIVSVHVRDTHPLERADRPPHRFHGVALRVIRLGYRIRRATPFQAVRPVQRRGKDIALVVKLRDRLAAVEQRVRLQTAKAVMVPGTQAVRIVGVGRDNVAVRCRHPIFGVKLSRTSGAGRRDLERVAVAVVENGYAGKACILVVGVEGRAGKPRGRRRVAGQVIGKRVGVVEQRRRAGGGLPRQIVKSVILVQRLVAGGGAALNAGTVASS